MSLFKILKGPSSRIDLKTTPFTDGYAYFTPDNEGFYIDAIVGSENKRIRVNQREIVSSAKPSNMTAGDIWLKEVK